MTTPRRDNARLNTGEVGTTGGYVNPHSINKIDRIRLELARPEGLSRFEAERLGDHCLNSTVAAIRRHGVSVWGEWETVPTKYSPKGVRVMRYWAEELKV